MLKINQFIFNAGRAKQLTHNVPGLSVLKVIYNMYSVDLNIAYLCRMHNNRRDDLGVNSSATNVLKHRKYA